MKTKDDLAPRPDPHSYYQTGMPRMTYLDWKVGADFDSHRLEGTAVLLFDQPGTTDLDTRDLEIVSVTEQGNAVEHELFAEEPVLGSRLRLKVPDDRRVRIKYRTGENASALQWLEPEQTLGGKHPYLFSQCQAVHARSMVPCQDSPGVRFTYRAELKVPYQLRGLMAAESRGRDEGMGLISTELWRMDHPIPAYLIALAVGNLESRDLSERSRVWSEPEMVEAAAREFKDVELMMLAGEELFGPYPWRRFDIAVMPPGFPYGGMENPCLTFLTPAVVVGDRSLVDVVVHELAHSWTGNLVTNATWQHFWLNEGWTVYAEGRIVEELYGVKAAMMGRANMWLELERDLAGFASRPWFTALCANQAGQDPDELFSRVPYAKGSAFLRRLEELVGRKVFDPFIRSYIERFAFTSIGTGTFLDFVADALPGALERARAWRWVYGEGVPDDAPKISSDQLDQLAELARTRCPNPEEASGWSTATWVYYLDSVPRDARVLAEELEANFSLSTSDNAEKAWAWYMLALDSGVTIKLHHLESFLARNGRLKYLRPIYERLARSPELKDWAREVFARLKSRYHPILQQVVDRMFA